MARERCTACGGDGWLLEQEHASGCSDAGCTSGCPVAVQVECPHCNGGYVEVSD